MKKYIIYFTLFMLFFLGALGVPALYVKFIDDPNNENVVILRHQLSKIQTLENVQLIFVGDSSLGNAIDSEYFSQLSGLKTANLALTGSFGYAGDINLIKRILESGQRPSIIVMHTLDMATRDPSYIGYVFTMPELMALELAPETRWKVYGVLASEIMDIRPLWIWFKSRISPRAVKNRFLITNDYLPQHITRAALARIESSVEEWIPEIDPSKVEFLLALAELCKENALLCRYAHGPIFEDIGNISGPFLRQANQMITSTGLNIVPSTPILLAREQLGDGVDHSNPLSKRVVTEKYYMLIKKDIQLHTADHGLYF